MSNLSRHKKYSCKMIVRDENKEKILENYEKIEDNGSNGSNIKIVQNNHTDTVNNITNNTVNNILNINQYGLNPYGKENMDYMDKLVYAYLWGLEAKENPKDKISEVA